MSNSNGPSTWFSGHSAPEDQKGPSLLTIGSCLFAVYSPLGAVIVIACYILFNYYRVSHKVIAGVAAVYCVPYFVGVTLFSSISSTLSHYNRPDRDLVSAILNHHFHGYLGSHWLSWITAQFWLSLAMGLIVGTIVATWKWIRRPEWEDNDRVPGPIHRLRRRRVIKDIASDVNGPFDGATIGVDPYGNRVVQTEAEAAAHALIAGGSGSGKTTTMMVGIRDAIRRGEPVCVVDLKGATDLPAQLAEWANRYGRKFLHWSITDPYEGYHGPAEGPAFYDPISRGTPSRKKDLLVGSEKWDAEYYKSVIENYLQTAFKIAELVPNPTVDAFTDLAALLDVDKLKKRAAVLFLRAPKNAEGEKHAVSSQMSCLWWEQYVNVTDERIADVLSAAADILLKPEESERSAIRNMGARIQKLRQSTAGEWLKRDEEHGRDIDFRKAADEGWVVVFSLDSANYEATSAQIGGLVIQDLKTLSADLRTDPAPHPFHVYVDEFSALGSDNIIGMLARARDARMPTMLSTQALADLKRADPAFLDQVLGVINSFIIHRANTEADAEVFAGLTGKKKVFVKRYSVEMTSGMPGGIGTGSATGQGMIQQEEDYVVAPSGFQALQPGELVYIAKAPESRVVFPVTVIREDPERRAQAIISRHAPDEASPATHHETRPARSVPLPLLPAANDVIAGELVTRHGNAWDDTTGAPAGHSAPPTVSEPPASTPPPDRETASSDAEAEAPTRPPRPSAPSVVDLTVSVPAVPVIHGLGRENPAPPPGRVEPAQAAETWIAPAAQATERSVVPIDRAPAPAPITPPVGATPVLATPEPVTTSALVMAAPAPEDEGPVFGVADVEWEAMAPGWGLEDLAVGPTAPASESKEGSREDPKLPRTTDVPVHAMFDQSEWND